MRRAGLILIAVATTVMSCKENTAQRESENRNLQSEEENIAGMEREGQEQTLFNGENLNGWKAYNAEEITKWSVEDGVLVFDPSTGRSSGSENLITEEEYTNFELSLDWKISEGGNSGIMWGVQEEEKFSEPYFTGPEIQILDNQRHPDAKNGPVRQAGALYDLVEPKSEVTRPAGEWNSMVLHIDYRNNQGYVILNNNRVTDFPLHGEEWERLVQNSKFQEWEDFGKHRTGHIALQDHGDKVWFRNIRIKELN